MIWIKAGVPLVLGVALILMFDEGESSVAVRFAFGLLWFLAGAGIAWVSAREG